MTVAIVSGPQPARKLVATLTGDAAKTTLFTVPHDLGQDVIVSLHETDAPYGQEVEAEIQARVGAQGRTRMTVLPLRRSVGLSAGTASSRVAMVPICVRRRPSRTRSTIFTS